VEHIPRKETGVPVSRFHIHKESELPDGLRASAYSGGRA
jgi:hypothetical protein